ncbi:MAG: enoyl-CoA hydratase/isomerase family protein [Candidatus Heimdallarchaeota archaeon]|nr:enoyl-CoA hydratase/isomerase family protein [Candidatus Heimdallarchaeota archaeon]
MENLTFEQKGNYGIVRINRPSKKNALHFKLLDEINNMFTSLKDRKDLDVIILTGYKDEETSFFSSGIDLNELQELNSETHDKNELNESIINFQNALHSIEDVGKTVIAQVMGFCFGSGLEVALACDFIVTSPETKFGLLETKFGIIPDLGGTFRLIRRVGHQYAKQIIMLAETFDAKEALRLGIVDWIKELDQIENYTMNIIDQLNNNKFQAVIAAKELIAKINPIERTEASKYERLAQMKLILK